MVLGNTYQPADQQQALRRRSIIFHQEAAQRHLSKKLTRYLQENLLVESISEGRAVAVTISTAMETRLTLIGVCVIDEIVVNPEKD